MIVAILVTHLLWLVAWIILATWPDSWKLPEDED